MNKYFHILFAFSLVAVFTGCARYNVIPENLENQVNHQLNFTDVRDHPEKYKGELMVVGGEVLSIERLEDKTKLEILQLPLDDDMVPANRRPTTNGRFIALSKGTDPLDPAALESETPVTIVGEIVGSETIQVDKEEKTVPVYDIKDLTIWDKEQMMAAPYYGYGYGYPAGFYSGYRPFGYPYY